MEKITMLGVSQSGKTCFIYAMYDFMQSVQNGFTFITNDPDLDMDLNEGWDKIAYDGIWPDGTNRTSCYDFTVMFKSQPIMEFSWCDYRGGAITENQTQQEVAELHQRINDSECLIICIGADTIKAILSGDTRTGEKPLKRLHRFIGGYAKNNQRRIPIIFALTKADLYTRQEQQQLLGVVKKYFSTLYVEGAGWLFAVVPVTLGNFESSCERGERIQGVVEPKNIHIPVMFFLHSIIKERISKIQSKLNGILFQRDRYRREIRHNEGRSWWDKFWNGDDTSILKTKIENLSDEEKNILSQKMELEQVFSNMKDMFNVCKVFYDGQPMSI